MKINFTLCTLIATLFSIHQTVYAGDRSNPFTTATVQQFSCTYSISLSPPSKLISFKASMIHRKVLLQWVMVENETTDQFEVEKSTDGKNFVMAALIFGTDKPDTDSYEYFENMKNEKISYRLKIIDKNKQVAYSDILVIKSK